ncbi:hypothetical protein [Deinococcus sp. KSM4-11]|uniref:hypothetical protein n=1 Tax=Deinococcus sp. KSM4-11 TaxID=2568654 RepID=UPI001454BCF9|nr:hypothetical protein [Deinococcus sp. KSM4-11]
MNGDEVQLHVHRDEEGRYEVDAVYRGEQVGLGISWFREDAQAQALEEQVSA